MSYGCQARRSSTVARSAKVDWQAISRVPSAASFPHAKDAHRSGASSVRRDDTRLTIMLGRIIIFGIMLFINRGAELAALRELVRSAYSEGWRDSRTDNPYDTSADAWDWSAARAALHPEPEAGR